MLETKSGTQAVDLYNNAYESEMNKIAGELSENVGLGLIGVGGIGAISKARDLKALKYSFPKVTNILAGRKLPSAKSVLVGALAAPVLSGLLGLLGKTPDEKYIEDQNRAGLTNILLRDIIAPYRAVKRHRYLRGLDNLS